MQRLLSHEPGGLEITPAVSAVRPSRLAAAIDMPNLLGSSIGHTSAASNPLLVKSRSAPSVDDVIATDTRLAERTERNATAFGETWLATKPNPSRAG